MLIITHEFVGHYLSFEEVHFQAKPQHMRRLLFRPYSPRNEVGKVSDHQY